MSDRSQKTEQATARRLERARREGQFPNSRQFVPAAQFLVFTAMLAWWGGSWLDRARYSFRDLIARAFDADLHTAGFIGIVHGLVNSILLPVVWAGGMLVLVMVAAQMIVTRFGLSLKKLSPKFERLNPLARVRGLAKQNLTALVQAVIMLPVFGASVYFICRGRLLEYMTLPLKDVEAGVRQVGDSLSGLLWRGAALFLVFGLVDLARERRKYMQELRMTKQELREEFKETEGNPQMKMRVRRLMRDRMRRAMMKEVSKATAVIVNPTHYAVAIRYQLEWAAAPQVIAKGKNYLALRIRQRAVEHGVPLVENPPLAQALYASADVGQEIPAHLYRAVAEVLAYIYRLMHGRLPA